MRAVHKFDVHACPEQLFQDLALQQQADHERRGRAWVFVPPSSDAQWRRRVPLCGTSVSPGRRGTVQVVRAADSAGSRGGAYVACLLQKYFHNLLRYMVQPSNPLFQTFGLHEPDRDGYFHRGHNVRHLVLLNDLLKEQAQLGHQLQGILDL